MPYWAVVDTGPSQPEPGYVMLPGIRTLPGGTRTAHGPYDTEEIAEEEAVRLRAAHPEPPRVVIRVVEGATPDDAMRAPWSDFRDLVDARRAGWGWPSVAEELEQNEAALAAHPVRAVPETQRLLAALRTRMVPVELLKPRWRLATAQTRTLRLSDTGVVFLYEFDEEAGAVAGAAEYEAIFASRPAGAPRPRLYRSGRLVALYAGKNERVTDALCTVLGPPSSAAP
jgi:hypothetical protein